MYAPDRGEDRWCHEDVLNIRNAINHEIQFYLIEDRGTALEGKIVDSFENGVKIEREGTVKFHPWSTILYMETIRTPVSEDDDLVRSSVQPRSPRQPRSSRISYRNVETNEAEEPLTAPSYRITNGTMNTATFTVDPLPPIESIFDGVED
jgi:hypothetical protein